MLNDEKLAKKTFRAIEDFIEFKKQCLDLVMRVFQRKEEQTMFTKCVRTAFEKFLNIDPNIIAEYLAKFLDFYLKKNTGSSNVTMNDEKLEKLVTDTIEIFKFVNAKDVFEEFYLRGLARRLLLKKSASTEAEKIMLSKIRTECSPEFGTKTDSMLKDLQESEHIMKEYRTMKGGEDSLR
jgi:cullin 4